jgi:hypothetical protein
MCCFHSLSYLLIVDIAGSTTLIGVPEALQGTRAAHVSGARGKARHTLIATDPLTGGILVLQAYPSNSSPIREDSPHSSLASHVLQGRELDCLRSFNPQITGFPGT